MKIEINTIINKDYFIVYKDGVELFKISKRANTLEKVKWLVKKQTGGIEPVIITEEAKKTTVDKSDKDSRQLEKFRELGIEIDSTADLFKSLLEVDPELRAMVGEDETD